MAFIFYAFALVFIVGLSLANIVVGFMGIENEWGFGWAVGAIFLALLFRFTLPLTIGAFYGALNIFGWHWFFALLFAAPGLALLIPGSMIALFSFVGGAKPGSSRW